MGKTLPSEKVKYNETVVKIYADKKQILTKVSCLVYISTIGSIILPYGLWFQNGEVISYDYLINTMPLNILLDMLEGEGVESVKSHSDKFRWSASNIVGIGLKGKVEHFEILLFNKAYTHYFQIRYLST